jgi:hypothetical protein
VAAVQVGIVPQLATLAQVAQTISEVETHDLIVKVPIGQLEQPEQREEPLLAAKVPLGQPVQPEEPALGEKDPLEQAEQLPEPLLGENLPVGQIEQPHKLTLDTPTFGLALYI